MIKHILKLAGLLSIAAVVVGLIFVGSLYNQKLITLNKVVPEVVSVPKAQVLEIKGTILKPNFPAFGEVSTDIVKLRKQLVQKVRAGHKHMYIHINSGGGLLHVGMRFVHMMRAARQAGVKLTCVVDGVAASMALIIYSECDERFATFGSKIMWHSIARISQERINEARAKELATFLEIQNEIVWHNTRVYFWPNYFIEHFRAETMLDVSEVEQESFGYLRVIRQFNIK